MLNYSVYLYICQCGAVSRQSAKQPLLATPDVFGLSRSSSTTAPNTYGGLVKRSDRFSAIRFHWCRLVPVQAYSQMSLVKKKKRKKKEQIITYQTVDQMKFKLPTDLGSLCYRCLNNSFQRLNNITRIFTHFFTHTYFQKIQTMLLEISY